MLLALAATYKSVDMKVIYKSNRYIYNERVKPVVKLEIAFLSTQ